MNFQVTCTKTVYWLCMCVHARKSQTVPSFASSLNYFTFVYYCTRSNQCNSFTLICYFTSRKISLSCIIGQDLINVILQFLIRLHVLNRRQKKIINFYRFFRKMRLKKDAKLICINQYILYFPIFNMLQTYWSILSLIDMVFKIFNYCI